MSSRNIAAGVLLQVIKEGKSMTASLASVQGEVTGEKDWGFVQALCFGVCRQYFWLEQVLQSLMKKPLKNKDMDVKVQLMLGLYQLRFMRVQDYAAVSETVAALNNKTWARPLANAVLRNFIRRRDELEQQLKGHQAIELSHPEWMLKLLKQCWPDNYVDILKANNRHPPMVLRVNLEKVSREDYLNLLAKQELKAESINHYRAAIRLEKPCRVEALPGFAEGLVSVQDTAAQLAAKLLNVQTGQSVLDMCAAPGGKAAAVLEVQPDLDKLVAVDVDEFRMQKVQENLKRLQLEAELRVADASEQGEWSEGLLFDRVLLDAPCSALGVIRRHPDIKLLRRETDIDELVALQQKILEVAWLLLKPSGILLYATCSVLKQENVQQMQAFLAAHPDAEEIKIKADWGHEQTVGRQILTGSQFMDGFYYARLRKTEAG